jgi:hypothetical protein
VLNHYRILSLLFYLNVFPCGGKIFLEIDAKGGDILGKNVRG